MIELLPTRSSSSTLATVTNLNKFELASSHARFTSIKFTKRQRVSKLVREWQALPMIGLGSDNKSLAFFCSQRLIHIHILTDLKILYSFTFVSLGQQLWRRLTDLHFVISPHWSKINEAAQDSCNTVLEPEVSINSRNWKFYQGFINGGGVMKLSREEVPPISDWALHNRRCIVSKKPWTLLTPIFCSKHSSQRHDIWRVPWASYTVKLTAQ